MTVTMTFLDDDSDLAIMMHDESEIYDDNDPALKMKVTLLLWYMTVMMTLDGDDVP